MTLDQTMKSINDMHGAGTIRKLQDKPIPLPTFSTGIIGLDRILGGGIAMGRIVEIYGMEAVGKSSLVAQIIAQVQSRGETCAFIDAEQEFDEVYAQTLGVDLKNLLFSQPDYGEQALEVAHNLSRDKNIQLIVLDSVAALSPKKELEGEVSDSSIGLVARKLGQTFRMMKPLLRETGATFICVNQVRTEMTPMGTRETTPGGRAMKFFPSQRIDLRRMKTVTGAGEEAIGLRVRAKTAKNKVVGPFKAVELDLDFGHGFSAAASLIDEAAKHGLACNGRWVEIGGKKYNGREQAKKALSDNSAMMEELWQSIQGVSNGKEENTSND